ncbi:Cobyrinic acid ac-diamide synthase [mine drainage metagenome]|uniref:Cobyrinic acid ac-diamide synthase n=1 Tax=mine drainage metagenome TaxID=410659 RepID=T1CKK0_9ZZZZ
MMYLREIREIIKRSEQLKLELKKEVIDTHAGGKTLERRWSIGEVARIVGRKTVTIRSAEERGTLPRPEIDPERRRRVGYRIEQIINMFDAFHTAPKRAAFGADPLCVLTFQNFKGGVAKSILSSTIAEYLALHGLRVLLVDCDPQATTTRLVGGYSPDEDLDERDTLLPFFAGEQKTVAYAVRKTHWANLKIIPANLLLYAAEYSLENRMIRGRMRQGWRLLERGLAEVGDDYDVVVLDPPPALGMISLNVLHAANSIVVPMPPNMVDLYSTLQFYTMLEEVLTTIQEADRESGQDDKCYRFIKVMVTRKRQRRQREDERSEDLIVSLAKKFYGQYMMNSVLYESEEITAAAAVGRTVLEVAVPVSSRSTHARALHNIEEIGSEIMALLLKDPGRRQPDVLAALAEKEELS